MPTGKKICVVKSRKECQPGKRCVWSRQGTTLGLRRPSVVGVQPGGGSRAAHSAYSLPVHLTVRYKGGGILISISNININFRLPSPNLYLLVAQR